MILVSATGKVGSESARLLAERGEQVRVLAHHPENAAALTAAGAEVVRGDLDSLDTIDAAMAGITSIVLTSSGTVPQHELNVIRSAMRAGTVSHLVKASSPSSPESPIARQRSQFAVESALRSSGLDHTLIKSNFYMQNLLMQAPAIVKTNGFGSSAGAGKIGLVDSRDVAAVAAEVAAAPNGYVGQTYEVTGPDLLSYFDVADILSLVLGRTITFTTRTREQDVESMVAAGLPEQIAAMNAHAVSLIAEGTAAWISDDVQKVLGRSPRSFEQFATDHTQAFARPLHSA